MENRSRNTIAGRAAILKNGGAGNPKQAMNKMNQMPEQRNIQNYDRQMVSGGVPRMPNNGNYGAGGQLELNLKVTPPPSYPPVERNTELQRRGSVSSFEQPDIISIERLQEAIIWSEILGEPISKRRRRR